MQVTRERLLDNLYSAFDKAPDEVIALRIGSGGILQWTVTTDLLSVTDSNHVVTDIHLTGTLLDVLNALRAAGIEIKYVNSDLLHLHAGTLLKGTGDEAKSNGDQLKIFTSTLWALVDAFGVELSFAEQQIAEAIANLYINTATGEILDYWGEYFGSGRLINETDVEYRTRLLYEILRPKSNKYALINAASAVAGQMIDIYEPWTDLFWLSDSHLDNEHLYDGDEWSPYVFRPVLRSQNNINWTKVLALLDKIRPAAVFPLTPEWVPSVRQIDVEVSGNGLAYTDNEFVMALYADKTYLDTYHFGDPIVQNYQISKLDIIGLGNYRLGPLSWDENNWDEHSWDSLGVNVNGGIPYQELRLDSKCTFVRADAVLSDMDESLGDLRCRFTMQTAVAYNVPILGEFVLSGFDPDYREVAEEDVYWPNLARGHQLQWAYSYAFWYSSATSSGVDLGLAPIAAWDGSGWDSRTWWGVKDRPIVVYNISAFCVFDAVKGNADTLTWNGYWDDLSWDYQINDGCVISTANNIHLGNLTSSLAGGVSVRSDVMLSASVTAKTNFTATNILAFGAFVNIGGDYISWDGYWSDSYWNSRAKYGSEVFTSHVLSLGQIKPSLAKNTVFSISNLVSSPVLFEVLDAGAWDASTWGTRTWRSIVEEIATNQPLVASTVVMTTFLKFNQSQQLSDLGWSGVWDDLTWSSQIAYDGVCISFTTEYL